MGDLALHGLRGSVTRVHSTPGANCLCSTALPSWCIACEDGQPVLQAQTWLIPHHLLAHTHTQVPDLLGLT
jgi:hypothetical protein